MIDLRKALGSSRYLLGEFSYADIAMAVVLHFVVPPADEYVSMGPATRQCWTTPALADEFRDLIYWRDQLYADHRRYRASQ